MIIALETSSTICEVAFYQKGKTLAEFRTEKPMQHASVLGTMVEQGLKKLDNPEIDVVAVAIGPGSFTGLRIGLSYAQGFCFGRNISITGIPNHTILAASAPVDANNVFTIIDARREEVYLATNKIKHFPYSEMSQHQIVAIKDIADFCKSRSLLIINENMKLKEIVEQTLLAKKIKIKRASYSAALLARLAEEKLKTSGPDDINTLEPLYIRPFAGVL